MMPPTGRDAMRRLQANGTTIAYAQTAADPPIVLMHGAEAGDATFARKAIELAGRTASADDQRACRGTCIPEPPDALRVARDAAALIGGRGLGKAHNANAIAAPAHAAQASEALHWHAFRQIFRD